MISARPMAAASRLVEMASWPSCAATTLERSSESSRFRPPIRMVDASSSASWASAIPSIIACPSVISAFTLGTLTKCPS